MYTGMDAHVREYGYIAVGQKIINTFVTYFFYEMFVKC